MKLLVVGVRFQDALPRPSNVHGVKGLCCPEEYSYAEVEAIETNCLVLPANLIDMMESRTWPFYSYRSASIGSRRAALRAG